MELINPQFLRTFKKAYEIQSFTKTSQELGMTQSGVSQHIAQLEETLETQLFERIGRNIIATESAHSLYRYAENTLESMEQFIAETRSGEQALEGVVRFGVPGSYGANIMPEMVRWQRKNPGLIFHLEYGPNHVLFDQMLKGQLDLAVTYDLPPSKPFESVLFAEQEYILVAHPSMKVSLKSFEDFLKVPMVNYVGGESIFQRWLAANFPGCESRMNELNFRCRINNMEAIFDLVRRRVGATIFPSIALENLIARGVLKRIPSKKKVTSSLYLVQRRDQVLSKRISELREMVLKRR